MQPAQHQNIQPGRESLMNPKPKANDERYVGVGKLEGRVALITGGDSGIGKAVAIAYAKEGADVAIVYLDEHDDAEETKKAVEEYHRECILIPGDVGDEFFCIRAVAQTLDTFGHIDIIINNAAEQHPQD